MNCVLLHSNVCNCEIWNNRKHFVNQRHYKLSCLGTEFAYPDTTSIFTFNLYPQLRCCCWFWSGGESWLQWERGKQKSWAGPSDACTQEEKESMRLCLALASSDCTVLFVMTWRCMHQMRAEYKWLQLLSPRWGWWICIPEKVRQLSDTGSTGLGRKSSFCADPPGEERPACHWPAGHLQWCRGGNENVCTWHYLIGSCSGCV